MKPVVVFIATFVVATAASTGAKVMMTKPGPVPREASADSTAASDSTHTDSTAAKSAHAPTAPADSGAPKAPVAPPIDSSKRPAPTAKTDVPATAAVAPAAGKNSRAATTAAAAPAPSPAAQAATDSATQASERRVAKVFTAMDAKQAAKVLEHMSDGDIQIILGYVGPRQAASILAELKPERVATLSKLSMQPPAPAGGKKQ